MKNSLFPAILLWIALTIAFPSQAQPTPQPTPDLDRGQIGYWPFDSLGINRSVNRLPNTDIRLNQTTPTKGFDGKTDGAINLYGNGSHGRMEQGLQSPTFSFSLWFNTNAEQGGVLLGWDKKGYGLSMMLGGKIKAHLYVTNNFHYGYIHEKNLADGQWHHVVGSFDSETFRVYIDGAKVHENKQHGPGKAAYHEAPGFNIGGLPNEVNKQYYAGLLDELILYNRALSESEIKLLYHKVKPMADDDLESGLMVWLPFEQDDRNTGPNQSERTQIEVYGGSFAKSCKADQVNQMKYLNGNGDFFSGTSALEFPKFSLCFRFSASTAKESFIAGWDTTGYRIVLNPKGNVGKLRVQLWWSKTEVYTFTSTETLNDQTCHHIALTFDGQCCRVFIDGMMRDEKKMDNAKNPNGAVFHAASKFLIGSEREKDPQYGFQGKIDDVRLYNRPLDKNEVKKLSDILNPLATPAPACQCRFYETEGLDNKTFLMVGNTGDKAKTIKVTDAGKELFSRKIKPGETPIVEQLQAKVDRKTVKIMCE